MTKPCVDCVAEGVTTRRPLHPDSGPRKPRCSTHQRAWKKRAQLNAHGKKIEGLYGITPEQYRKLYEAQGGRCALCGIANGKTRRLAVDHDHRTGLVRGLSCSTCNRWILGAGVKRLVRALEYLDNPPATKVIGYIYVPSTGRQL